MGDRMGSARAPADRWQRDAGPRANRMGSDASEHGEERLAGRSQGGDFDEDDDFFGGESEYGGEEEGERGVRCW